jgi:hypothetical protein
VQWTLKHQQAFEILKDLLGKATVEPLYIIDFKEPFNILSMLAILQTSGDGTELPLAFASLKLLRTHQR